MLPVVHAQTVNRGNYQHQKINEREGNFLGVLADADNMGCAVTDIGDLNKDGATDLLVGAWRGGSGEEGSVWLWLMKPDGTVLREQEIGVGRGLFRGKIARNDAFGSAVLNIGDWDGDTINEVLITAPMDSSGRGALWLLSLAKDGMTKRQQRIGANDKTLAPFLSANLHFGDALAMLPDFNGDGIPEIAVGVPSQNAVYVLSFDKSFSLKNVRKLAAPSGVLSGDRFGAALALCPDLNGDGISELLVGAPATDDFGDNSGAVWVLFLDEKGEIARSNKISNRSQGISNKLQTGDAFGSSIAVLHTYMGMRGAEIAVGAPYDDTQGADKGCFWLLALDNIGEVTDRQKISELSGYFSGTLRKGDRFGSSLWSIGGIRKDGSTVLAVGAPADAGKGRDRGAVWLLFNFPSGSSSKGDWFASRYYRSGSGSGSAINGNGAENVPNQNSNGQSQTTVGTLDLKITPDKPSPVTDVAPPGTMHFGPNLATLAKESAINNLILLLDVSGSMTAETKLPLLKTAFLSALFYMRPEDKITIITYSGSPFVAVEAVPATEREMIADTIAHLISRGPTDCKSALKIAYEIAAKHYIPDGNNRIILATDGGFDIPATIKVATKYPQPFVPLTVFQFGRVHQPVMDGLKSLASAGKGNFRSITPENADSELIKEIFIRKK